MNDIYMITNQVNGKKYIGLTTVGWRKRCKDHFTGLTGQNHCNGHLQSSWNCYGREVFVTGSLEVGLPDIESLKKAETFYITKYDTFENGYNLTTGGDHTTLSDEVKKRIGNGNRGKQTWLGKTHSLESKQRISEALKGHTYTDEQKQLISRRTSEGLRAYYAARRNLIK